MKGLFIFCFAFFSVLLAPSIVQAQSTTIPSSFPLLSYGNHNIEPMGDRSSLSAGSAIARLGGGDMAWYNPAGVDFDHKLGGILRANGSVYSEAKYEDITGSTKERYTSASYLSYTTGFGDSIVATFSLAQPVNQKTVITQDYSQEQFFGSYAVKSSYNVNWGRMSYGASLKYSLNNHHFGGGIKYNDYSVLVDMNTYQDDSNDYVSTRSSNFLRMKTNLNSYQYDIGYQYHSDFGLSIGAMYRSSSTNETGSSKIEESLSYSQKGNYPGQGDPNAETELSESGKASRDFKYREPELTSIGLAYVTGSFGLEVRYDAYAEMPEYTVMESYNEELNNAVQTSTYAQFGLKDSKKEVKETSFNINWDYNESASLIMGYGKSISNESTMFLVENFAKYSIGISTTSDYGVSVIGLNMVESTKNDFSKFKILSFILAGKLDF